MSHHPSAASTQQSHDRDALAREAPPRVPDHVLLRPIGRGSYGDVWLARSVMGTYRAVKIVYRRNFKEERPFEREFSGLQKFEPVSRTHEGLVDLLQVGRNEAEGYYYYVMELGDDLHRGPDIVPEQYEPKTLAKVVTERGRLSFEECLVLSLALARGLNHLHQHGLIHRDIKPSNIIFVNDIPKIADIGLVAGVGTSESFVGTEGFIPPEGPGTPQADIYSLGKVLYEISTGKDRHKFPEVPSDLGVRTDRQQFLELNEVILRACDGDLRRRYQSIEEMLSDLVLLHAGKSVKRLRLLEKRFAILTRAGAILAALACIAGAAFYQARQARIETTRRLASSYVTHGTLAVHQRDLIGSLPWYAEALRIEEGDPIRERRHRVHLSVVLGQCPILAGMWFDNVPINCVEFSPDGRWLAIAGGDGKVTLRDLEDPSVEPRIFRHSQTHEAETAAFSSDGELLLTSGIDGLARVWSLATCQEVSQALVHPEKIYSARFSPDGEWIVTACADGKVRVWERRTGALRDTLEHHAKAVRFADFSPDGQKIITSSQDWTALVIDLKTREVIGQPLRHSNWIYKACFSPDGRVVATCSFDGTARLWDVASGHSILLDHTGPVRSIAFSPDGRRVVTACWDYTYTVRVWDSATGKEVLPPLKHNNQVLYVGFNPNGRQIVTGST
ncbi:MAG: serine/threonine-protein kinase, partial [Verrucomicrobiota bacterium]